jgi:hypothetical protein
MQSIVSVPSDFPVLLRPEGEVAVKELCESLESTRGLLAERAGQAQLETTGLEPLPQDRRSLAFVQAVFKHNFSPSNIEDAIIALKDFQFEVESCQQTTELAFQQVWRVYDIVKIRTLQRRSSVSTISTISTLIPESSTEPQATSSFRTEVIDWLKRQDVASKSHSETPNAAIQEDTSTPDSQPTPISRDQEPSRNRIRNLFSVSRAKHDYKKIEPFYFKTLLPPQHSPHATETLSAPFFPLNATYGVGSLGSYTFKQGPAGIQPPSQPWSNKPSPAVLTGPQTLTNGISVECANGRSGVESRDNSGDDSIRYEEKEKGKLRARGLFGGSKGREREKEDQKELIRMIGKC